jgi:hypothetical protein
MPQPGLPLTVATPQADTVAQASIPKNFSEVLQVCFKLFEVPSHWQVYASVKILIFFKVFLCYFYL